VLRSAEVVRVNFGARRGCKGPFRGQRRVSRSVLRSAEGVKGGFWDREGCEGQRRV
jgi:hypothetical protein